MWDILGLDAPTDDIRVIKKAYAKKLRVTRPDDDPAAFMALREALERAKHYASYAHEEDDAFTATLNSTDSLANETETPSPAVMTVSSDNFDLVSPVQNSAQTSPVQDLLSEVETILKEPFARTDKSQWAKIFDDERLDAIDNMIDFEDLFRNFLLDEFGYFDGDTKKSNRKRNPPLIPSRLGTMIFNNLGWRESHGRALYVQDQIEWLRKDLDVLNQSTPQSTFQFKTADPAEDENDDNNNIFMLVFFLVTVAVCVKAIINYAAGSGL